MNHVTSMSRYMRLTILARGALKRGNTMIGADAFYPLILAPTITPVMDCEIHTVWSK